MKMKGGRSSAHEDHWSKVLLDFILYLLQWFTSVLSRGFPVVIHGTYKHAWPQIKKTGLSKMKRTHIHMATGEYGSATVISGTSICLLLKENSLGMLRNEREQWNCCLHRHWKGDEWYYFICFFAERLPDGIEFFLSANGVVLSTGVDGFLAPKYFRAVLQTPAMIAFDPDFPQSKGASKNWFLWVN